MTNSSRQAETPLIHWTKSHPRLQRHGAALATALALAAASALPARSAPAAARDFDCVIKPSSEVRVSAPITGIIADVKVDRGSTVAKGDVVAVLDSEVERASLAIAKRRSEATAKVNSALAKIEFLRRKSQRSRKLNETQIVSESTLEEVETNLAVAREDLVEVQFDLGMARLEFERAGTLIDQRTIRSPIAGVVTERKLSPGEYWSEKDQVVTIAALDPLYVEAFLPIAMHGRIHKGDVGIVMPEEPIGGRNKAVVEVIDHVYDAASSTFGVRLSLPNKGIAIPAGIRCRVAFESDDASR